MEKSPLDFLVQQLERAQAALKEDDFTAVRNALDFAQGIASHWQPYLDSMGNPESAELSALRQATESTDWPALYEAGKTKHRLRAVMCSTFYVIDTLQMLIRMSHSLRILEIGMFTGYSALGMAEALPSHGRVTALELDPYLEDFATPYFSQSAHGRKITVKVGAADQSLLHLAEQGQQYDFIFLDADKVSYQTYYDIILGDRLLRPGGVLVVDNTFMKGKAFYSAKETCKSSEAIREFNAYVKQDSRVNQVMLPVSDGLMVIRNVQ